MSNFTENENWIDKVIDELVDANNDLIDARITSNELYTLKEIIFSNATLDYSGKELRISNESAILEYLRTLYPDSYDIALTRLKEAASKKTEEGSNNV